MGSSGKCSGAGASFKLHAASTKVVGDEGDDEGGSGDGDVDDDHAVADVMEFSPRAEASAPP